MKSSNIKDTATMLISKASLQSVEIAKLEPFSHTRIVMGACIGPAEVRMILTAGLAYAAVYVASYQYESNRASKVNRVVLRQLNKTIGVLGDARFDGRFVGIWNSLLRDLTGQDAARRIGYALCGDSSQLVPTVVKTSAEWALRTIDGTGYMPGYVRDDSKVYNIVLEEYQRFAKEASGEIDFNSFAAEGGFKSIDLEKLPPCNDSYDIFISYRKSDGDVYARLLNQELNHQGMRCFFDVESVSNGEYSLQILSALRNASHFLFLKSVESLNGLDDPDDHVRIELEAARFFKKNVIIVAPMGVTRDMSRINLPAELEYLRDLRAYKLDVGETYEFCIDKILQCGVRHEQLA
jgi:hypothetical protein